MSRKTRWAWGLIVYVLVAVLLFGGVIFSAYLTIFQLAPALVTLSPNLEIARTVATVLSITNPVFTILILLFAIHDKRTKRTIQISEWQQKHFEELKDQIPTFMNPSYLRDCKLQIETALMGANGGAAFAEIWEPKTRAKREIADLISNGMKDYRLELPVRVKRVMVALAEITREVDSEQAELFRSRDRGSRFRRCGRGARTTLMAKP